MNEREAIVIGAGPGGLAAAAMLRRSGVDTLVVERSGAVGASWRGHYDRLHLHTVRWLSHLPGLRIPRRHGAWVSRDGVIEYLERYAAHHRLEIAFETPVSRIERDGDGWRLDTPRGPLRALRVVVATGYNNTPFMPDFPGRDGFTGELVHASRYRNAEPYRGRDVLVVGSGNTGAEIAVDLVETGASRVRLAVRTPPNILLRDVNGLPGQLIGIAMRHVPPRLADPVISLLARLGTGDLTRYGVARPPRGPYTRAVEEDVIPILDVGLVDALKQRRVEIVGALEGFEGGDALLAGGERIQPDAVIVSTGWRRGLEPLVGHLGVLGRHGRPTVHGGRTHAHAPGVYFTGFTNPISGMFREMSIDARRIARAIARDLHPGGRSSPSLRVRPA